MTNRIVAVACAAALSSTVMAAQVQRRAAPATRETVPMTVALQVGGQPYAFSGQGLCQYAERASIYAVPASMWSVQQNEGSRSLALTLWHPANGAPDMMSLNVSLGSSSQSVSTVKGGGQKDPRGSGTATLAKAGAGGVFTIDATSAAGTRVTGTIKCDRFTQAIAEGGE